MLYMLINHDFVTKIKKNEDVNWAARLDIYINYKGFINISTETQEDKWVTTSEMFDRVQ